MTSSSLLKNVIANSNQKSSEIRVNCLVDLLACSGVLPSDNGNLASMSKQERFHYHLLGELFRDMVFYYHQMRNAKTNGEARLKIVLLSLAGVIRSIGIDMLKQFLDSVWENEEACWFLISSLANHPAVSNTFFKDVFEENLLNLGAMTPNIKSALQVSMTVNLSQALKPVFKRLKPDIQAEIKDILKNRKELE